MIELRHLTKHYGNHTAVDDLSITIPAGQVYGFLGPNGAGKTTTMNIMTGCLAASEGQVLIDGLDIYTDAAQAKRRIGYLPEQPPVYPDMTPKEYLRFVGQAKGLKGAELRDQVAIVMDKTHITAMENRLIRNLSKGYRQRVGIAQAILGSPDVVILDEPMVGLDPAQIIEMRELIRELGQSHTVILSSHILSEISMVCDHIMIISHGRLVASGTPEELSNQLSGDSILALTTKGTVQQVRAILSRLEGVERLTITRPGEAGYDSAAPVEEETADSDGQWTGGLDTAQMEEGTLYSIPTAREERVQEHGPDRRSIDETPQETLQDVQPEPDSEPDALCTVELTPAEGADLREAVFFAFCDARIPILSMSLRQTSLEEVFLEVTADQPQGPEAAPETYLYGDTYVESSEHPTEENWTPEMLQPMEPIQVPEKPEQEGGGGDAGDL